MKIEGDGNDFMVQFSDRVGGGWVAGGVFEDAQSARQHALHLMDSGEVLSVRVLQTQLYGWRDEMGFVDCGDGIGEQSEDEGR